MRHFYKLAEIDVGPLMAALVRQPELWDQFTLRTTHPGTAHAAVSDIWLQFNDIDDPDAVLNDREVVPYPAWSALPQARLIIFNLMRHVEAVRLGRVIITRLPPGAEITPHVDGGAPAQYFTRYQVALQCLPGNVFHSGEEQVSFRSGDVWMVDNRSKHGVVNNSADDRIVMIVDLRCC